MNTAETKDQSIMNAKERFDALMNLANFYREVREARIRREWRVTFGLWVGLATIAISAASTKAIPYYFVDIKLIEHDARISNPLVGEDDPK